MAKVQPTRQCIGCREMKNKNELIKVVKTPEGEITLDLTGRMNGRGAYMCQSIECLNKAKKCRGLSKSFKMEVPDSIYLSLEKELSIAKEQ